MDECIIALAAEEEQPTDTLLIHLMQLQLIVDKVGQAPGHDERDDTVGSGRVPPIFYLKTLQGQLKDFKARIPPSIQKNRT